jgi:hypothetical protein
VRRLPTTTPLIVYVRAGHYMAECILLEGRGKTPPHNDFMNCTRQRRNTYSIPPYKRWGPGEELTCQLQGFTSYGIRFSHKTYRPSPTKDVT